MKNFVRKIKIGFKIFCVRVTRFVNNIFLGARLTERGRLAKAYAFKVATTGYEPVTYQETLFEEELNPDKYTGEQRQQWYCVLYVEFDKY